MGLAGPGISSRGPIALQHGARLPPGQTHQVGLPAAFGQPLVREGVAQLVRVQARQSGLLAAASVSEALDTLVFDQIRRRCYAPGVLLAGERAVAVRASAPDDRLLAAQLGRLDRKAEAAETKRRRMVECYHKSSAIQPPSWSIAVSISDSSDQHSGRIST
jgi:hypothetical protein